jgi:hypothetical protein
MRGLSNVGAVASSYLSLIPMAYGIEIRGWISGTAEAGSSMIKAYLLIMLIGTIAAMSHLDFDRKSAGHKA